ncbi:MAG TPA: peptide deformylase [Phnomibacter sp.]|nr:peptide deformylase [Phnomibacter sp.]
MILPIVAYGSPILRQVAQPITPDYPQLETLINNMWETMYQSNGVGLAAPQINKPIRLFVIDTVQIFENMDADEKTHYPAEEGTKACFINPQIVETSGQEWPYNEGCLSIPKIREDVLRPATLTLEYLNEQFEPCQQTFTGITGRVIMHEYDHLEGKLFIDYLSPLKRKLLQGKLADISKGRIKTDYRMIQAR